MSKGFIYGLNGVEEVGLDGFLRILDRRKDVEKRQRGLITGGFGLKSDLLHTVPMLRNLPPEKSEQPYKCVSTGNMRVTLFARSFRSSPRLQLG